MPSAVDLRLGEQPAGQPGAFEDGMGLAGQSAPLANRGRAEGLTPASPGRKTPADMVS
jgi:hypothetical protein